VEWSTVDGNGLVSSSFSSAGWPLFTRVSMHPKQE